MAENTDAKLALFAEIERQAKELADLHVAEASRSAILRDLAAAYRMTVGGAQPGSSVVSS